MNGPNASPIPLMVLNQWGQEHESLSNLAVSWDSSGSSPQVPRVRTQLPLGSPSMSWHPTSSLASLAATVSQT